MNRRLQALVRLLALVDEITGEIVAFRPLTVIALLRGEPLTDGST